MTKEERNRISELIRNPPAGSKIAAAKEFGIDLTLLIHSLQLTPAERLRELARAQPFLEELERARRTLRNE